MAEDVLKTRIGDNEDDEETLLENVNFRFPIFGAIWAFLQQSVEKGIENVNVGIELPTKNPLIDGEMDCNQLAQGRLQGRTFVVFVVDRYAAFWLDLDKPGFSIRICGGFWEAEGGRFNLPSVSRKRVHEHSHCGCLRGFLRLQSGVEVCLRKNGIRGLVIRVVDEDCTLASSAIHGHTRLVVSVDCEIGVEVSLRLHGRYAIRGIGCVLKIVILATQAYCEGFGDLLSKM